LRQAAAATIERLEPRMLLSLTAAQVVYNWKHAHPGFLHDLAVYEYEHPDVAARQTADLQRLGLPPITPVAPSLMASATSSARGTHHPRPHKPRHVVTPKPKLHPKHGRHVRGNGPMIKDNPGSGGPTGRPSPAPPPARPSSSLAFFKSGDPRICPPKHKPIYPEIR